MGWFESMDADHRLAALFIGLVALGTVCAAVVEVADAAFSPERERCEEVMGDGR